MNYNFGFKISEFLVNNVKIFLSSLHSNSIGCKSLIKSSFNRVRKQLSYLFSSKN